MVNQALFRQFINKRVCSVRQEAALIVFFHDFLIFYFLIERAIDLVCLFSPRTAQWLVPDSLLTYLSSEGVGGGGCLDEWRNCILAPACPVFFLPLVFLCAPDIAQGQRFEAVER